MFFVALKLLPQQGQIYFLVLLGFLIFFGASAPFPLFDPPTGAMFPKDFLKIKISSKSCEIHLNNHSNLQKIAYIHQILILTTYPINLSSKAIKLNMSHSDASDGYCRDMHDSRFEKV